VVERQDFEKNSADSTDDIAWPLLRRRSLSGVFASRAEQNPDDFIDWTQLGPDSTELASPQTMSTFAGNPGIVRNTNGGPFLRVDEGTSWIGNF
jgi:hypothetical protein